MAVAVVENALDAVVVHGDVLAVAVGHSCVLLVEGDHLVGVRVEARQTTVGTYPDDAVVTGGQRVDGALVVGGKVIRAELARTLVHAHQTVASAQPQMVETVLGDAENVVVGKKAGCDGVRLVGVDVVTVVAFQTRRGTYPQQPLTVAVQTMHLVGGQHVDGWQQAEWQWLGRHSQNPEKQYINKVSAHVY